MNRRDFLVQSALSAAALSSLGRPAAAKAAEARSIFEQVRAGRPLEGVDAIDAHAHFDVISGDLIWPLGVDALETDSRRCGIGLTVVSPFEGFMATSADQLRVAHDACVEAVAKYNKSLRAYLVFQPHLLKASTAEMKRALEPGSPFVGFKLHGDIDRYPADGPNYQPVFEFANEHGLPVLYHQWGGLERVASTLPKYPRLNMIIAHLGLWTSPDSLGTYLKALPNLYTDTCSSALPYGRLERFVAEAGAKKILFGTDATYLAVGPQIAKVAFARISEEEKSLIFGGNARRIFGSRLPSRD